MRSDDTSRPATWRTNRRTFLIGAGAAVAAACSGSDDADTAPTTASPDDSDVDATEVDDLATTTEPSVTTSAPTTVRTSRPTAASRR